MRSFTVFATIAAFLPAILAQVTVPACVTGCIGTAASMTSCQTADTACLCAAKPFIDGVSTCMIQSCTPEELAVGVGFGEAYCASVGVRVSIPSALRDNADSAAGEASASASASPAVDTASASSAFSSAASSASQSIAASGTTGSPAAPSQTGAAPSLRIGTALAFAGVGAALLL
ncbi:hypothetical protein JCM11491_005201 [Sporobolomyces phaffii]